MSRPLVRLCFYRPDPTESHEYVNLAEFENRRPDHMIHELDPISGHQILVKFPRNVRQRVESPPPPVIEEVDSDTGSLGYFEQFRDSEVFRIFSQVSIIGVNSLFKIR